MKNNRANDNEIILKCLTKCRFKRIFGRVNIAETDHDGNDDRTGKTTSCEHGGMPHTAGVLINFTTESP